MREISIELFGTPDYESVLEVMSPTDGLVREFHRKVSRLSTEWKSS